MASKSSDTLAEIRRAFAAADADGNGVITPDELFGLMKMLKKGQEPTQAEVQAIGQKMDKNGDGQISEEEFTESMLSWLQAADTPITKRRRASTDEESPGVRKRVHQQIAAFFRDTGVRPDHVQLQKQILERGADELDMDSWRNSFQTATPQVKAALLDDCSRIKEIGRETMQLKLHAADPAICLEGAIEVQTLLSLVEVFPSASEREELAYELLEAFEGVTILSNPPVLGSDGRPLMPIVHRLCVLLDDNVATQIQIVACRALYYFTIGPRIPHTSKNSRWHPDKMWTKELVVSQNLPARLMHIIRSTTGSAVTKTAEQLELLEQAIRCAGAFAEQDRQALDLVLQMGLRPALLEVLKQNPALSLIRACTYTLSVCCGHTHSHHLENGLQSLQMSKEEMEEITTLCDTVLREVPDEAAVCNAVLILRSILPLWDPILHQMNELLVNLLQAQWATAVGGKFTVITILLCLQEVLLVSADATRALLAETDLATIVFNQLGMGSEHPQIAGAALGILNVLLEHHLYEDLMDPARGFLRQLIALVQGSDLSLQKRAIRMLLSLSASGAHLTATIIAGGGVDACSRVFQSFKQHDNILADVYGFLGASYNVDLVAGAVQTLRNMLNSVMQSSDKDAQQVAAFNLNQVERVSQLHGVIVQEMSKSKLYPSDDLVELCTSLYRMLEEFVEAHRAANTTIAGAVKTSCEELMNGWDDALTNAFNTGSQEKDATEMDIMSTAQASAFHESTGPLLEARGIPQWNSGEGKDVRVAQVPEHAKWTELRSYFTTMYGTPVLCQVEDHATQEKITVDRQEVWDGFVAHHKKTKADEPLRIYLLLASGSSKFSNGQAAPAGALADDLGPKSMELKKLRGLGIHFNPKLMSDVYDYYKTKGKQAINLQEFIEAMSSGPSPICSADDANQLFAAFDFDGNGELSFTEVATGLSVIMSGTLDERLYCAFKAFDEDGNGNLDVHEVTRLLQSSGFSFETAQLGAQDVFRNADQDGNGLLSFEEFKAAVMSSRIMLSTFWTTGLPGLEGYQHQGQGHSQQQQRGNKQHHQQHQQYDDYDQGHHGGRNSRRGGRKQNYGGRGRGGRGGNMSPPALQRQHNSGQRYPQTWRSGPSPFARQGR